MKELKRKQDEEELRRREQQEASRFSAVSDKTDGEKSETQSIKSGGNLSNFFKLFSTFSEKMTIENFQHYIGVLLLLLQLN